MAKYKPAYNKWGGEIDPEKAVAYRGQGKKPQLMKRRDQFGDTNSLATTGNPAKAIIDMTRVKAQHTPEAMAEQSRQGPQGIRGLSGGLRAGGTSNTWFQDSGKAAKTAARGKEFRDWQKQVPTNILNQPIRPAGIGGEIVDPNKAVVYQPQFKRPQLMAPRDRWNYNAVAEHAAVQPVQEQLAQGVRGRTNVEKRQGVEGPVQTRYGQAIDQAVQRARPAEKDTGPDRETGLDKSGKYSPRNKLTPQQNYVLDDYNAKIENASKGGHPGFTGRLIKEALEKGLPIELMSPEVQRIHADYMDDGLINNSTGGGGAGRAPAPGGGGYIPPGQNAPPRMVNTPLGLMPEDAYPMTPSEEGGMIPSEEGGMIPSREGGNVPTGAPGAIPPDIAALDITPDEKQRRANARVAQGEAQRKVREDVLAGYLRTAKNARDNGQVEIQKDVAQQALNFVGGDITQLPEDLRQIAEEMQRAAGVTAPAAPGAMQTQGMRGQPIQTTVPAPEQAVMPQNQPAGPEMQKQAKEQAGVAAAGAKTAKEEALKQVGGMMSGGSDEQRNVGYDEVQKLIAAGVITHQEAMGNDHYAQTHYQKTFGAPLKTTKAPTETDVWRRVLTANHFVTGKEFAITEGAEADADDLLQGSKPGTVKIKISPPAAYRFSIEEYRNSPAFKGKPGPTDAEVLKRIATGHTVGDVRYPGLKDAYYRYRNYEKQSTALRGQKFDLKAVERYWLMNLETMGGDAKKAFMDNVPKEWEPIDDEVQKAKRPASTPAPAKGASAPTPPATPNTLKQKAETIADEIL